MSNITQVLTVFGENFYLVVVLCVEILIAVLLFGMTITKNMRISKRKISVRSVESEFLEAMDRRPDEVCLVVRIDDIMPVYASGHFKDMFGVSLEDVRGDMALLNSNFENKGKSFDIWEKYRKWDGKEA